MYITNLRDAISSKSLRCDRASCMGNPYDMKKEIEREKVISLHKLFLYRVLVIGEEPISIKANSSIPFSDKYRIVSRYNYLTELGKVLTSESISCWCAPLACHCNNYLDLFNSKRVCISGSRSITDKEKVYEVLDKYLSNYSLGTEDRYLIHGAANKGVDSFIDGYGKERGWKVIRVPAEWEKLGKGAGFHRNEILIKLSNHFIALWDGESKGTGHAIEQSKKCISDSKRRIKLLA